MPARMRSEQLLTLAVHDIRPQQAAARVRVQQQVCHVGREPGEDLLAHRAVVGKLGLEAHGLDLAELAHARRDARAVEALELGRDRLQIGQARAAAPQHIRQHGRARRRFSPPPRPPGSVPCAGATERVCCTPSACGPTA